MTNLWKCGTNAFIDGVIDIAQTQFIYNNVTKSVKGKQNNEGFNNVARYYIVGA